MCQVMIPTNADFETHFMFCNGYNFKCPHCGEEENTLTEIWRKHHSCKVLYIYNESHVSLVYCFHYAYNVLLSRLQLQDSKIQCARCKLKFYTDEEKSFHESRCSGDSERPYACSPCQKTYRTKQQYLQHLKRVCKISKFPKC